MQTESGLFYLELHIFVNLSDHLDRTVEHAGGEWKSSAALLSPSLSLPFPIFTLDFRVMS